LFIRDKPTAWRAIAEVTQRSGFGWVTKIFLELLRALEGTLSCWLRLHLQSLAPTPFPRKVCIRQSACRKISCRMQCFSQHGERHVEPNPLIRIIIPHTNNNTYIIASQIFLLDAHVLPKLLNYEEYYRRDRW
jgi:hypothetical protein